jgi:hypothetical protein
MVQPAFPVFQSLLAYKGELRQVFENLVQNAIEAVGKNGFVSVRARTIGTGSAERLVGMVCDSVSGIASDIRAKIFDPFVTTKEFKGSGLGLWVSRSIVQKHGGMIRERSSFDQRWKGAAFLATLPLSPTLEAAGPPSAIRQQSEGSELWLSADQLKFAHNRILLLDSLAPRSSGLNGQLSPDEGETCGVHSLEVAMCRHVRSF